MQNRFASLFIAALLPLLLFRWFVPTPVGQIDFWLMWLLAMVVVGLPLLYAEIGLAHRSQKIPAKGIQELTRQADTSTIWRSFVWLTVLLSLVIAGLSIDAVSANLLEATQQLGLSLDVPPYALGVIMVVIAGMLSLLGGSTLVVSLALITVAFVMAAVTNMSSIALIMTEPSLGEWARAVTLALVSVGVGTGLFWFNNPLVRHNPNHSAEIGRNTREIATKTVLPIWLTQLVIGSMALIFTTGSFAPITTLVYAFGVLAASAFFMHYASAQIANVFQRFGIWIATAISMLLTILLVVIASPQSLAVVLVIVSVLSALVLAIFSGWQMKISHMRKSLNFSSEGIYNLWRVAIRILAPLLIIVAVAGWLMS
ncbi:hypothetical protein A1019T_00287 [Psychrobacter pasteurii]|uniref:Uncharacterized protein n=1 Tax=Psychrobacter pasteurii TaxID=1945520 RepID=A0A1R4ECV3_9GAMM|nr:hypothetical protein [Psychrobacter pasteurii]SJM36326.1 hypothetical protein A1019T_00287 [Psychrobacter pasteurii]